MRSPGLAFALVCAGAVRLSAQASLHADLSPTAPAVSPTRAWQYGASA